METSVTVDTATRKWILLAVVLLLMLASVVVPVTPASAATAWPSHSSHLWSKTGSTPLHRCTWPMHSYCGVWATARQSTPVYMLCWTDQQYYVGNHGSKRWFLVNLAGSRTNTWVHSSFVYNQASSPRC